MTKITNIDKTPNDYVKEEEEDRFANDPDHQQFEYTCPNTGAFKSEERYLLRIRLAQYTHWIADEIKRLEKVREKIDDITSVIDEQVEKEKEANKDG